MMKKYFEKLIPVFSVVIALVFGFLFIVCLSGMPTAISAFTGLWDGAFGSPKALMETLVASTPYLLAGLAVALGFQAGLFNIGAEGQLYMGALAASFIGFSFSSLPAIIHVPFAVLAGAAAGFLWGAVPGWLKTKTGAHEVINTIMMNYIAIALVDYLVKGPLADPESSIPRTPYISPAAQIPKIIPSFRLHYGLAVTVLAAFFLWWFLRKTVVGIDIRAVGANPSAAEYAGVKKSKIIILTMALSGALAGLAGTFQTLGLNHNLPAAFTSGYGFDSIAVALLAKSHPLAVIPSALLWGALRNGAGLMQLRSGISIDLINIIQAGVIALVAADILVRKILRLKKDPELKETHFASSWGK